MSVSLTTAAPIESKRVLAGVLAILLGCFGVHKFVLGYTGTGVIMLLVSTVGGCVTIGWGTLIMGLIGVAEGIIYLTKSDQNFVQTYQVGRRAWF